jgi:2-iminobutanoate/2-iminopropanoate deaminase
MKKSISISGAPKPLGPYSPAVLVNNMLFVSGQLPLDTTGELVKADVGTLTKIVMENIGKLLAEAGMDYSNIVKTSIFLSDLGDFAAVNEAYGSFFTSDFPARETVQVARLPKDSKVEISVIAAH